MAQIKINYALLMEIAYELDLIAGDMSGQNTKLSKSKKRTEDAWQSTYTAIFSESVFSTQTKIENSCEAIRNAARVLRSIARQANAAEEVITAAMSQGSSASSGSGAGGGASSGGGGGFGGGAIGGR